MLESEFDREMERLEKFYDRRLTHDQKDLWFDMIGDLPRYNLTRAIDQVMRTKKSFPTPSELLELANAPLFSSSSSEDDRPCCDECGGFGFIQAGKEEKVYAFRCWCGAGQKLSRRIPDWSDELNFKGYERLT